MRVLPAALALLCLFLPPSSLAAFDVYPRNVAVVIWNGAEILDWAGPCEVFEAAARFGEDDGVEAFHVYTVSLTRDPIVSQGFVDVIPDHSIRDAPTPDIVVLPGGGTGSVLDEPDFLAWAGAAARQAEIALSVCTGAFILGEAGLLDGQEATTFYNAVEGLRDRFPEATVQHGRRFVDNGRIVTTAGVSAGIDGSLHVVARLLGRHVADRTAEYMEYAWSPPAYLARNYPLLNPSLDERGRRRQQARIDLSDRAFASARAAFTALVEEDPDDHAAWEGLGEACHALGEHARAADAYREAASGARRPATALYNAACSAALAGEVDAAFADLEAAIQRGFAGFSWMEKDEDLAALRGDPRWKQLMARAGG